MGRGRPSFLNDRVSTTVSLERDDLENLHNQDVDISVEFREWVKFRLNKNQTPLQKMKAEEKELLNSRDELDLKIKRLQEQIRIEEEKEAEKKEKQLKIEEFENEREIVFIKIFKNMIFKGALCEVDFYSKVKKELKFKDQTEAKYWLLERYKVQKEGERKFTEDRIKTFLRWDADISRYW